MLEELLEINILKHIKESEPVSVFFLITKNA